VSELLRSADLRFLLYEWLDVEALTARPRYADHSRETFDAALALSEQVATEQFAPLNKLLDQQEPALVDGVVVTPPQLAPALDAYRATGLLAATADAEVGGWQVPHVVAAACALWFQAASVGAAGYVFLTQANANLLLAHGSPEQVDTWVRPLLEGRYLGTMCLSEPQAGSSLADVTTVAESQDDGTYRIVGSKMWISGGDHELAENIVHLVLARTPGAPPGVKGISLFLVPKWLPGPEGAAGAAGSAGSAGSAGGAGAAVARGERNDVTVVGLNHKMGYRGTVNTVLAFGDGTATPGGSPGAVGYLVGERHQGLAAMFHMMNEARIGVGAGAVALGYTGYLKSLRYARERAQGRPVASRDPAAPPVPIVEHADVRRMLLAQKSYVEGGLALVLYCARLVDELKTAPDAAQRQRAGLLLDVLTPVAKSWPSQWCLQANDLAIQVHGGYGYTRDYDVEQHYRDNRLNPIHEGTAGIQALDLLGRKVVAGGGNGLQALAASVAASVARAEAVSAAGAHPVVGELAAVVSELMQRVVTVTGVVWAPGDPELALANASLYLEAAGHVVVGWMWLEQVLAADGRAGELYDGKRAAAQYFARYELPRVVPSLELLAALDRTTLDLPPGWL
jgi:butyryl-CoA dehydrogenase